jgi:nucleoside-diphosphate-sugar epimerase
MMDVAAVQRYRCGGLPFVRALCTSGHEVTGMTRAGLGVDRLPEIGAPASSADAFDRQAVRGAIAAGARCSDRPAHLAAANPADIIKSIPNDTRLHEEGGGNLLTAAQEMSVARYILQSRGFFLDAPYGRLANETARRPGGAIAEQGRKARRGSPTMARRSGRSSI